MIRQKMPLCQKLKITLIAKIFNKVDVSDIDKDTTKEDEMFDYVGIPYYKDECIKEKDEYIM